MKNPVQELADPMDEAAAEAADLLKSLSNAGRLRIDLGINASIFYSYCAGNAYETGGYTNSRCLSP